MLKQLHVSVLMKIFYRTYRRMYGNGEGCEFGLDLRTMRIVKPHTANLWALVKAELAERADCIAARHYEASRLTPDYVVSDAIDKHSNQHCVIYYFSDQSEFIMYHEGQRAYRTAGYMMARRAKDRFKVKNG